MVKDFALGVDIGTTRVKAMVVEPPGRVIGEAAREYGMSRPRPLWVEQEPEDWWRCMAECVREATSGVDPAAVRGLALSTQGGTLTPVDREGRPLRGAMVWMDERAQDEPAEINRGYGTGFWYERNGKKISPGNTAAKVLWLARHEPDVFKATFRFTEVQDYLVHRLTGAWALDLSSAAYVGQFNVGRRAWDPDLLKATGIRADQLSPVRASGSAIAPLTSEAADALGLTVETLVCGGAHDQTAAAVGTGTLAPGQNCLSCGTAWVLYAVLDRLRLDPLMRLSFSCHAVPDTWSLLTPWTGCAVLDWFVDNFCGVDKQEAQRLGRSVYEVLLGDRAARHTDPLLFHPHLYGALSPAWKMRGRGALLGLTLHHSRGDVARAIMEGLAFQTRWNLEVAREVGGRFESLRMIGGAARSDLWAQILADACGVPVVRPLVADAACLGAATLAALGSGLIDDLGVVRQALAYRDPVSPDPDGRRRMDHLYRIYRDSFGFVSNTTSELQEVGARPAPPGPQGA